LKSNDSAGLKTTQDELLQRAKRGMFAGRFEIGECRVERTLQLTHGEDERSLPLKNGKLPSGISRDERASVALNIVKAIPHPIMSGKFAARPSRQRASPSAASWSTASSSTCRCTAPKNNRRRQRSRPAVLEEAFFTCRIDAGWRFEFNSAGDILLSKA